MIREIQFLCRAHNNNASLSEPFSCLENIDRRLCRSVPLMRPPPNPIPNPTPSPTPRRSRSHTTKQLWRIKIIRIVTQALVNCTRGKPQISVLESKVTGNRRKRTVSRPLRTKRSHRASIHTHSHIRLIARDLSGFYPNSNIIPFKPASSAWNSGGAHLTFPGCAFARRLRFQTSRTLQHKMFLLYYINRDEHFTGSYKLSRAILYNCVQYH